MLVFTTMATSNIGSASWNNADDYEPGAELHTRAVTFLDAINWEALTSLASKLRDGTPCRTEQPYSIGHFNMVRRITFADDVSWVARLRMPDLDAGFGSRESLSPTSLMRVEVATVKYLRLDIGKRPFGNVLLILQAAIRVFLCLRRIITTSAETTVSVRLSS